MQRAVLVAGAVHGVLDEVTGGVDAAFVQLQGGTDIQVGIQVLCHEAPGCPLVVTVKMTPHSFLH